MEHRYYSRRQKELPISLHRKGAPVIHCKSKNIGQGGIFVKTGGKKYKHNGLFKVELELIKNGMRQRLFLPAIVVPITQEGLGLMFVSSVTDKLTFTQV